MPKLVPYHRCIDRAGEPMNRSMSPFERSKVAQVTRNGDGA